MTIWYFAAFVFLVLMMMYIRLFYWTYLDSTEDESTNDGTNGIGIGISNGSENQKPREIVE